MYLAYFGKIGLGFLQVRNDMCAYMNKQIHIAVHDTLKVLIMVRNGSNNLLIHVHVYIHTTGHHQGFDQCEK